MDKRAEKNIRFAPREENETTNSDSKTNVNTGFGVWGNRRKVVGIRVDEELYNRFKPVAKRVFGSVCNPIECFMASVIAMAETHVNFGNTVEIGKLVIERNLRARRHMVVDEFYEGVERVEPKVVQRKERKRPDYSKMSFENLQAEYDRAKARDDYTTVQLLAFELKRRGGATNEG